MRTTAVAVLLTAGLAGCGGGSSPQQDIQTTARTRLAAVKANDVGSFCRLTTDQTKCITALATARALGVKPSDFLKGNEEQRIKTMKITVTGNRAHSQSGNRSGDYIKRDGKWLVVWTG